MIFKNLHNIINNDFSCSLQNFHILLFIYDFTKISFVTDQNCSIFFLLNSVEYV